MAKAAMNIVKIFFAVFLILFGISDVGECGYAFPLGACGSTCPAAGGAMPGVLKHTIMAGSGVGSCPSQGSGVYQAFMSSSLYSPGMEICVDYDTGSCKAFGLLVCADTATVNNTTTVEDALFGNVSVTGVAIGSERDAAKTACDTWSATTPYPTRTDGRIRTDGLVGFIYTAGLDSTNTTATVDVTCYKRGGYTTGGINPVPLDGISGPGGYAGGGPWGTNGMAVNSVNVGDGVAQGLGNYFGSWSSIQGSTPSDVGALGNPGSFDGTLPTLDEGKSIGSVVSDFVASNPLSSVIKGSQVTAVLGQCSFTASVFGHDAVIDFCRLADTIGIFGTIQLLVCSIYSFLLAWGVA